MRSSEAVEKYQVLPAPASPPDVVTVGPAEVLTAWLDDCKFRQLSDQTIAGYRKRARRFVATLSIWPPSPAAIQSFINGLEASRRTKVHYWTTIKSLCTFARMWFGCTDPTTMMRAPQRPRQTLTVMSDEHAAAMYRSARTLRERLVILLILGAGLRRGEVCLLRPEDIGSNLVNVPDGKTNQRFVVTPPLLAELVASLGGLATDAPDWLFPSPSGGHVRPEQISRTFAEVARRAGIPREFWKAHRGRHFYATRTAEAGVPVFALQKQLGHSDPSTTSRYAHHGILPFTDQLRQASPARAFAPEGGAQLSLDAVLIPATPAASVVDRELVRPLKVYRVRTRLFEYIGPEGSPLSSNEPALPHGLTLRGLARAIGVSWATLCGVRQGRWGIGPKFIEGALRAFPQWSEAELFYQVEEEAA